MQELGCDSKHFKAIIQASDLEVITGKGKDFSDVDGNIALDDDIASWRHVSILINMRRRLLCSRNPQSTCTLAAGETSKCRTHNDGTYTCNDGLYLEGTETTNLGTINAKAINNCPPVTTRSNAGQMYSVRARSLPRQQHFRLRCGWRWQ